MLRKSEITRPVVAEKYIPEILENLYEQIDAEAAEKGWSEDEIKKMKEELLYLFNRTE